MKFLNDKNWTELQDRFLSAKPFNHVVIDDFFTDEVAARLVAEFPHYDAPGVWNAHYHNAIEDKKACNHWDKFPEMTYSALHYLCSDFEHVVTTITGNTGLQADVGLHGGGWHAHTKGGKLNVHLDYNIHPKIRLQRHYNIIIYLTPNWQPSWNGGLELWSHNHETQQPLERVHLVENRFNRAVLFDTTQYSWHGLPDDLNCPDGIARQSMAVYYVTQPETGADTRGKALFAPHGDQANDPEVLDLIKKRSQVQTAADVYKGTK
jgi:hypothetical protein